MHNYVLLLYHVASIYYMYVGLQNVVAWRYFWNIWELRNIHDSTVSVATCGGLFDNLGISQKDKKNWFAVNWDTQATAILLGKSSWSLGFREYTKAKSSMYPIFSDLLTVGKYMSSLTGILHGRNWPLLRVISVLCFGTMATWHS